MVQSMILMTIIMTTISWAQVRVERLHSNQSVGKQDLAKTKSAKQNTQLKLIKDAELSRAWSLCVDRTAKAWSAESPIAGWLGLTWVKCARKEAEENARWGRLARALDLLSQNEKIYWSGPWRNLLLQETIRSRMSLLEADLKTNAQRGWKNFDMLLALSDRMDREQKAKTYALAAELAYAERKFRSSYQFLLQSLAEKESRAARERFSHLLVLLNEKVNGNQIVGSTEAFSENESKFEERLMSSFESSDLATFVDDGVTYLSRFPNGVRAKFVQDKMFEIEQSLWGLSIKPNVSDKDLAIRARVLTHLMKLESSRLLDLVRAMHRRGDFRSALKFAERSLIENSRTSSGAVLSYIAGRSAQFVGEFEIAQRHFSNYMEFHGGSDDRLEVLFRWSLVRIRQKEYAKAIALLERILNQRGMEKYETSTRYWLVRCLQWTNNVRAEKEAENLISKYPMTYYAIRLQAERNKGVFQWSEQLQQKIKLESEVLITPVQDQALKRIEILSSASWFTESQLEVSELPWPREAAAKILFAQKWSRALAYPQVIRLINEAFDIDPGLRSLDSIVLAFPRIFENEILAEAKSFNLDPNLVRSLIRQESAFGLRAKSTSSALGLMQLIPPTATEVAQELKMIKVEIPEDVYEASTNIRMGTYYLSRMIKQFGNSVPLGLAAYNAGPHRLQLFVKARAEIELERQSPSTDPQREIWYDELPWLETSLYVKSILRNVLIYQALNRPLDRGRVVIGDLFWQNLTRFQIAE